MTTLQLPPIAVNDPDLHQRRLILVVDDEPLIRALLAMALREEGYDVVEAADGVEALEVLASHDCDLVLLDGQLPRLSGREVLEILRAGPRTATLPVILVTADDSLSDRVSGLSAGADDYVTKPFSIEEVVARVKANLRAHDAWGETLALHDRHRATLSRAFAGAAKQSTLEGAAAVLCHAIADQPGVAGVGLVRFAADGRAVPLARCGEARMRVDGRLVEHARFGPWLEHDPLVACAPFTAHDDDRVPGLLLVELDGDRSVAPSSALAGAIDCAAAISGLLRAPLLAQLRVELNGSELRGILTQGAFQPYFQPIVDLRSGEVVGAEALTRFDDGSSAEDRFVEAAAVGLGLELELATLSAAVVAARSMTPPDAWLSLNVSPELMLSCERDVGDVLDLRDRDVVLELSERELVTDYDAVRAALQASGRGVRWSIDDAGSGFASLRHILELEPSFIKLDRSWVEAVDDDPARQAMIAGLTHFARRTGAQLIAEGIERDEECTALLQLGVTLGQGFLLGRPVPVAV